WEALGILRYQPTRRLTVYGTLMRSKHGIDGDRPQNWGGNIHRGYEESRVSDTGNFIGQGIPVNVNFADLRLSYMLRHNFFIDGRVMVRREQSPYEPRNVNTNLATFGLRLNIPYRQQVF
ncbi:MAG: hypothetical protein ACK4GN_15490, partial [Runella sp.]